MPTSPTAAEGVDSKNCFKVLSQFGVLSATNLHTYSIPWISILDTKERTWERDLPGMETEAWNYARIGLPKLLHQVPIFLKDNIRLVTKLLTIRKGKRYLGDSIDGKTNDARIEGCCNQLGRLVKDSWVLQVTVRVKQFHHLPLPPFSAAKLQIAPGAGCFGANPKLQSQRARWSGGSRTGVSGWVSPRASRFIR